jgi:predicted phage terminase large subunit-like protein
MHQMDDGTHVIENIHRGRWGALDRERQINAVSRADAALCSIYEVYLEQEPGSGGKESAEASVRMLSGLSAYADRVTGEKEVRAEPFAAQVQNGSIRVVMGEWYYPWIEECESWPNGKFKDQVDSAAGAFAKLTGDGDLSTWVKLGS